MSGGASSAERSSICTGITYSMEQPIADSPKSMDVGAISAVIITTYQRKESISIKALMMV